jgi:hypothetical protein
MQSPGTLDGTTIVTLMCSEFGCIVEPSKNRAGDVVLSGWWDGNFEGREPFSVEYAGEDAGGSIILLKFSGALDQGRIWNFRLVGGWEVTRSRSGGLPGGIQNMAVSQPSSPRGWLVVTSAEDGGGGIPAVGWIRGGWVSGPGQIRVVLNAGWQWFASAAPPWFINNSPAQGISDLGNSTWQVEFPGLNINVGDTLEFTAYGDRTMIGAQGQLLAPFDWVLQAEP